MQEIVNISLENEMDLVVVNKRSLKIADYFNLSISAQTTFATAISEICREVIEKIHSGSVTLGLLKDQVNFHLLAIIQYPNNETTLREDSEGFQYAKRLLSQISVSSEEGFSTVQLKVTVPRSEKMKGREPKTLIEQFHVQEAFSPYEEVKRQNTHLNKITEEQKVKLKESESLIQKKNEFFSIASHELKTPLSSIKGYAQLALTLGKEDCSDKVRQYLSKINTQAGRLNSLIQQLLDVAKTETGKLDFILEEVSWDEFMDETIGVMRDILPGNEILVDESPNIKIKIDKLRIEQVFTNILGNASKYSKPLSKIKVHTTNGNDELKVVVQDEGIGMPAESTKKVFEKYYRDEKISKKYSGFGMGLYITSKIITEHGGRIWVESEEGVGSAVSFTIPHRK
jgi:signal transduction histidine kinase